MSKVKLLVLCKAAMKSYIRFKGPLNCLAEQGIPGPIWRFGRRRIVIGRKELLGAVEQFKGKNTLRIGHGLGGCWSIVIMQSSEATSKA